MIEEALKKQINWYDTDQTIAKDEIANYEIYINYLYKDRIKQINKDIYLDDRPIDMNIDIAKIAEQMFTDLQIRKKTSIKMVVKSLANSNLEITSKNMTDNCIEKEQDILDNIFSIVDEDNDIPRSDFELYNEWRLNSAIWNINNDGERTGLSDCFDNIVGFLENYPKTKGKIKFNNIRNIVEFENRQVVDGDYHTFINYINKHFISTFSKIRMVKDAVDNVANKNKYNPWVNYFNNLEYIDDGIDYIDYTIEKVLCCEEQEKYHDLYYETLKIMLLASMSRIYNKELYNKPTKYDTVVALCGVNGGSGKTTFFERLYDIENNGHTYCYVVAGDSFRPNDKDFIERSHQSVCLFLDELSMKRAIVTSVKGYITQRDDRFRKSYGYNNEAHMRGFIITASSNNTDILKDYTTDNERRWSIIKISENEKNYENVNKAFDNGYRDKLWSFIKNIYNKEKFNLYMTDDKLIDLEGEIQRGYKASNNEDYDTIINDLLEREYGFYDEFNIDIDSIVAQYKYNDSREWCKAHNKEYKAKVNDDKYIMKAEDRLIQYYGKIDRIQKTDLYKIISKLDIEFTKPSLAAEMRASKKWNGYDNKSCRIDDRIVKAYWRKEKVDRKLFEEPQYNMNHDSKDNGLPF